MGLLTLYNDSQVQLNTLDPDLVTVYPSTVTGTPTSTANPGGPTSNFDPIYNANNTYLDNLPSLVTTGLNNTLNITNLDIENPGVQGGIPYTPLTDPTIYPVTTTHTSAIRGYFAEPSQPALKYGVSPVNEDPGPFSPEKTYSEYIKYFF
jgi:hypothetical protein